MSDCVCGVSSDGGIVTAPPPTPLPIAPKPHPQAGTHEEPTMAIWRQYVGNQHKGGKPNARAREEKKAAKRTPPWKETQPAHPPGLRPFPPQGHLPKLAPPLPHPSVTLTIPHPLSPIPDSPILSQPPTTTAASTQSGSASAQKGTNQAFEDTTRSTGVHSQLLRWALSVPSLNELVDLTLDLRTQPPEA